MTSRFRINGQDATGPSSAGPSSKNHDQSNLPQEPGAAPSSSIHRRDTAVPIQLDSCPLPRTKVLTVMVSISFRFSKLWQMSPS